MENSLLIGLSRQMALGRTLDVIANNIANLNTTGFKADEAVFSEDVSSKARERQFSGSDSVVSFVLDRGTWHDFKSGPVEHTGNPLDVAIDGNAFLVVQTPNGERYTRNGALQLNTQGQVVTNDGYPVIGENGPITLQSADQDIVITQDGTIRVREGASATTDANRGKLRLVAFDATHRLTKQGSNLFSAPEGSQSHPASQSEGRIMQGVVEKSNVNGVLEMSRMIEVSRSYSQVAALLQQQSDMHRGAIDKLADVPA